MVIKLVKFRIVYVIFSCLIPFCSISANNQGNNKIAHQEFLVSLQYDSIPICGGSIIAARHVLTATHCVFETNVQRLTIVVNSDGELRDENRYTVEAYYFHSKFEKLYKPINYFITQVYDIAIVKIHGTFYLQLDSSIGIGKLEKPPEINSKCLVYGWGIFPNQQDKNLPRAMHSIEVVIREIEYCIPSYLEEYIHRDKNPSKNHIICSKQQDENVPKGDSGGPLICNNTIYEINGIVSTGSNTNMAKNICMYTDVTKFRKWISAQINHSSINIFIGGQFKYQVLIQEESHKNMCNGILIDKDQIITANSCLKRFQNISNLRINNILNNTFKFAAFKHNESLSKHVAVIQVRGGTDFKGTYYPKITNQSLDEKANCIIFTWENTMFVNNTNTTQRVFRAVNISNPLLSPCIDSNENEDNCIFCIKLTEEHQNYEFVAGAQIACNGKIYGILKDDYFYDCNETTTCHNYLTFTNISRCDINRTTSWLLIIVVIALVIVIIIIIIICVYYPTDIYICLILYCYRKCKKSRGESPTNGASEIPLQPCARND